MKAHTIVKKIAMLIVVVLPLLATAFAIRMLWERAVTWSDIALLFATYSCTALGITVGYHRMLTHRSFRPQPVIKFILLARSSRISSLINSSRMLIFNDSASSWEGAGASAFTRVRKYFSTWARVISLPFTVAQTSGPGAASLLHEAANIHAAAATRTTIVRFKRNSFAGGFKQPFSRGLNECRKCRREYACARL